MTGGIGHHVSRHNSAKRHISEKRFLNDEQFSCGGTRKTSPQEPFEAMPLCLPISIGSTLLLYFSNTLGNGSALLREPRSAPNPRVHSNNEKRHSKHTVRSLESSARVAVSRRPRSLQTIHTDFIIMSIHVLKRFKCWSHNVSCPCFWMRYCRSNIYCTIVGLMH